MPKTRKYKKKRGGGIKSGLRIGGIDIFEWFKPSVVDGRTCYRIGPFKWCTRKKDKTP